MVATSTGGSESALASIDVPLDGEIIGVEWVIKAAIDTTGDFSQFQLSFGSNLTQQNDSRQVISNCHAGFLLLGAGGSAVMRGGGFSVLPNISVGMGERLFLHGINAVAMVATAFALISFTFNLDLPKARRR
jgi:hypothetical protein